MERRFKFFVRYITYAGADDRNTTTYYAKLSNLKRVRNRMVKQVTRRVVTDNSITIVRIWLDGQLYDVVTPVTDDNDTRLEMVRSLREDGYIHRDELIAKKRGRNARTQSA